MEYLDEIFNRYKQSKNEVLSDARKIKILAEVLLDKKELINSLNARNKRVERQLTDSGCDIINAMGLDFIIENTRAEIAENKLKQIIEYIKTEGDNSDLVKILNIIKEV